MSIIDRMKRSGRPSDEISLVADGLAFRWLLDNGTIQPDERGEWSIVYICTPEVPINRNQAAKCLRASAKSQMDGAA
jgi:hypothetical protein